MPEEEPSILREAPPASEESASEKPAGDEPAGGESASDESVSEEPASEEPAEDESASEEPAGGESASDESASDESAGDESASEEPVDDESASEEPAGDEPAGDEPADDEPANEKAASDEPAADRAKAGLDRRAATQPARAQAPVFYVAGFWRRLAGAMVDLAIIVPVALLLSWLAGAITGVHLPPSRHRGIDFWLDLLLANDPALIGILGLTLAVATAYALIFQVVVTRTPGMRIMKIRIIDQYGDLLTTGRAAARTAGYLAAAATLGLGFIWMGFDSEKRGLHDWLSGTYVVKA